MSFDLTPAITLLKTLSWAKVLQFITLVLVVSLFFVAWTYRSNIYSHIHLNSIEFMTKGAAVEISPKTKNYIDSITSRTMSSIGGVQIIGVDFRKNTRKSLYFSITDRILIEADSQYRQSYVSATPLFNENEINNKRVVDLINGKFVCTPFKDTISVKIWPAAVASITTLCSVSIPPYYGKFSGYLNIFLKKVPDPSDIEFIRQLAKETSVVIYDNDIDPENKISTYPILPGAGHK